MTRHADRRTVLLVELLEGRLPPAAHTLASAEVLALGPLDSANVGGFLAAPDQHDLYRIELGRGDTLRVAVSAQLAGSGLRPLVRVFDAAGTEVALNNQEGGDPELTVQAAAAGGYFVGVSSAGNADYDPTDSRSGTPGATTGTYTLALAVRKGQPLAADVVASSFRLEEATAEWGETVHASVSVNNRGGAAAGAFTVQVVASADPGFDPATATPLLAAPIAVSGLAAGGEWSAADLEITLPATFPPFASAPADEYPDLFPDLGRLANGPIYLGLRITPAAPGNHFGHRGASWEPLTIVNPDGAAVRATAEGSFQRSGGAGYSFTISPAVGAGLLTATARLGPAGELPQIILTGADVRQQIRVVVAGTAANPTATLSQYLPPGTYILSVAHVNALTPEDPENHGRLYDFHLDAGFSVSTLNSRSDTPLGDVFPKIPVTITQAGTYTATAVARDGAHPVLSLFTGLTGDTLVYQAEGPPGDATAAFSQYLRPGVYFLAVGVDEPDDVRLTTTFTPTSSPTDTAAVDGVLGPVATGDFNNDGYPDLAVVHGPEGPLAGKFSILLGHGDGTNTTSFTQGIGAHWTAPAVGDLDGDGAADLVLANTIGVVVYRGKGDGTFDPPPPGVWAGELDPYAPAIAISVADLNGDGARDLVVAEGDYNAVRVLLADGHGGFRPGESIPIASPYSLTDGQPQPQLRSLAVADLNGDGIPDVLVTTAVGAPFSNQIQDISAGPGGVAVLLGVGDGTFRRAADLVDNRGPGAVAVADVNGDGLADVLVGNVVTKAVGVFLGAGGGRFGPMTEVPLSAKPMRLVVADFNRDGRPDLAAAGEFTVTPLLGDGRGGFVTQQAMLIPRLSDAGLAVADADQDGIPDLIVEMLGVTDGPAAGLDVLRGNGDGTFRTRPATAEPVVGGPVALAVGDFNGDGLLDVVTTLAREPAVAVRLGNGDGTYAPQASFPAGTRPLAVATADLNRDGRADIVVANHGDGTVGVLFGNGDGSFRPQVTYPVGRGPCALLLTDVNGDGNPDVVVANNDDGTVVTLLGGADGTLRDTRTGPAARLPGAAPGLAPEDLTLTGLVDVAAVDLNGDRWPDLVTVNSRERTVGVRFGYGDGSFATEGVTRLRFVPHGVTIADADGDGSPDVVVRHNTGNSVGILRYVGNGSFDVVERSVIVDDPAAVAVADLNGDGKPDLVAAGGRAAAVSVLLADGRGSFQDPRAVPVGLSPRAVLVRDMNADGRPDVVVVNGVEGTLSTLLGGATGRSPRRVTRAAAGGRTRRSWRTSPARPTPRAGRSSTAWLWTPPGTSSTARGGPVRPSSARRSCSTPAARRPATRSRSRRRPAG
ncbi:MAG: VCBS repeat-containing protein [Gemmataceae bacterium]